MPLLVLLVVLGGLAYWFWWSNNAVRTTRTLDGGASLPMRRATAARVFGTPLQRITDTRLAATVLMLQLVRTGAPVTAAEKTRIMELMDDPLRIGNIEAIFTRAWGYTDPHRSFSPVADELVPLLRRKLSVGERRQLLALLRQVAGAYGEPSELQGDNIARLGRRLDVGEDEAVGSPS